MEYRSISIFFVLILFISISIPIVTGEYMESDVSDKQPYLAWTYPVICEGYLDWSPDGELLAVGQWVWQPNNLLVLYSNGSLAWSKSIGQTVNDVEWSPDGEYLAVAWGGIVWGDYIGGLIIYNRTGGIVWSVGNSMPTYALSWSSNGEYIAIGGKNFMSLYTRNGTLLWRKLLENDYPYIIAISPTADLVAFAMWWEKVYVYSINGSLMWSVNLTNVRGIDWSPDGEYIAVSDTQNGHLKVYTKDGNLVFDVEVCMNTLAIDWSPSGDIIAIIGIAREVAGRYIVGVYLYSIDGQCIWSKEIGTDGAHPDIQWSVNGDFLAAIGAHKLVVFSLDGEIIYSYTFTRHTYDLDISIENMIAFIPDFGDYVYVFNWTYRPIPLFTYTPETPRLGDTIVFNASQSYDPDGNITSYIWDFGDGETAEGVIVNHTYEGYGIYNVTLKVIDDKDAYGLKTLSIKIPAPPVAQYNYTPSTVLEGEPILFNALLSYDPDGEIIGYCWDFGDGTSSMEPVVNHTFMEPGVYNVSLTVTDIDGLSSSIVYEITVAPLPVLVVNVNTDARIYIDDILYGTASPGDPLEIKVKPMTGAINVTAVPLDSTYLMVTSMETVELSPGSTYNVDVYMPGKPRLVIGCNIECRIYINDSLEGEASPDNPLTLAMEPGETILNITATPITPGYKASTRIETLTLDPDTETTINIVLEEIEETTTTTQPSTAKQSAESTLPATQPGESPSTTPSRQQGLNILAIAAVLGVIVVIAIGMYMFKFKMRT